MSLDGVDSAIATQLQRLIFLEYGIEAGAVVVAAISGMIAARSKRMDLVGTYIVAFITAFGGGTLRDILLVRRPLFWVHHPRYPIIIFVLALLFVYVPWKLPEVRSRTQPIFNLIDALGLALFSISGVSYALAFQMPFFIASLIGVITGVFGGVIRDVILNEIPMIFRTESSLYATCSFMGCWIFLGGISFNINPTTASFFSSTMIVILRLISLRYGVTLPTPCYLKTERHVSESIH